VYTWGGGGWGQLGIGMRAHRAQPTKINIPPYLSKYIANPADDQLEGSGTKDVYTTSADTPRALSNSARGSAGVAYRQLGGYGARRVDSAPVAGSQGHSGGVPLSDLLQVRTATTQPVARKVSCGRSHTAVLTKCGHVCGKSVL
jgi:hypothetical protein